MSVLKTSASVASARREPGHRALGARSVSELRRRPRLSPELERDLVAAAQDGDAAARAELVQAFMPLINSVARMYSTAPAVERQELLQEGVVGLLRGSPPSACASSSSVR